MLLDVRIDKVSFASNASNSSLAMQLLTYSSWGTYGSGGELTNMYGHPGLVFHQTEDVHGYETLPYIEPA